MRTNRRSILGWAAALAAARLWPQAPAAADDGLTITGLEVFVVPVNHRGDWTLVRVRTSAGLTGIGDASHGRQGETLACLRLLFDRLKGRPLREVESLRQGLQTEIRAGGAAAAVAMSALEQAAWDLRGQALGVPLYELFGGRVHDRVRCYANINRSTVDRTPAGFAAMAERAVAAGFDAVKLAPFDDMPRLNRPADELDRFTQLGIERARAVRRAIGSRDLLIDAHSHFDRQRGLDVAARLQSLDLFWLEEAAPANPPDDLAAINASTRMQTAGGEAIYGVAGFYPYLKAGAVDIAMPDVKRCGGMSELKKIAGLAEGAGVGFSPHGPASPVGNAAAAHVSITAPNFVILEHAFGEVPWRADLIDPPERFTDGCWVPGTAPGLGIRLNDRQVLPHRVAL